MFKAIKSVCVCVLSHFCFLCVPLHLLIMLLWIYESLCVPLHLLRDRWIDIMLLWIYESLCVPLHLLIMLLWSYEPSSLSTPRSTPPLSTVESRVRKFPDNVMQSRRSSRVKFVQSRQQIFIKFSIAHESEERNSGAEASTLEEICVTWANSLKFGCSFSPGASHLDCWIKANESERCLFEHTNLCRKYNVVIESRGLFQERIHFYVWINGDHLGDCPDNRYGPFVINGFETQEHLGKAIREGKPRCVVESKDASRDAQVSCLRCVAKSWDGDIFRRVSEPQQVGLI